MAPSTLRFEEPTSQDNPPKTTPHLLPCRVHHNGPVEPVQSFWDPKPSPEDAAASTAYFRGRKLCGKTVKLPDGYRGVVAVPTSSDNSQTVEVIDLEAADADGGMPAAQSSLVVQAEFDEMVLWGHDVAVDAVDGEAGASDPYMRAVGEWVAVAERIHSYSAPDVTSAGK
ncbi:hypothetical protein VTJ04DRAFT_5632 [Mycothermus thermophilus]|uniref:uncharacterized protein n=1 Tax=Humicola insolens TaxID=85995 RepID=UPI003743DEA9